MCYFCATWLSRKSGRRKSKTGKLIKAVRFLLSSGQYQAKKKSSSGLIKSAKLAGMSKTDIALLKNDLLPKKRKKTCVIWGQNVLAWRIFKKAMKCWIVLEMSGQRQSINFDLLKSRVSHIQAIQNLSPEELESLWEDVELMESVALNYWNKKASEQQQ